MRTQDELKNLYETYMVCMEDGVIVGGFSLADIGEGKKLLECIFSNKKGMGTLMMKDYITKQGVIHAYSKNDHFFTKSGFTKKSAQSESGAYLYIYY